MKVQTISKRFKGLVDRDKITNWKKKNSIRVINCREDLESAVDLGQKIIGNTWQVTRVYKH